MASGPAVVQAMAGFSVLLQCIGVANFKPASQMHAGLCVLGTLVMLNAADETRDAGAKLDRHFVLPP